MSSFIQTGRKIVAIGRNYVAHAQELGNAVPKGEPIMFLKPTSSYTQREVVHMPRGILVHHEVELGLVMKAGKEISQEKALDHVAGYALAIDYTGRNMQNEAQAKGLPWSGAKGFDDACPISNFIPKEKIKDPHAVKLWLKINGETKQSDSTDLMVYKIPRLIEHCSSIMSFEDGDLLLTGTPAGVGPVKEGDKIEAGLEQDGELISSISHMVKTRKGGYLFTPENKD